MVEKMTVAEARKRGLIKGKAKWAASHVEVSSGVAYVSSECCIATDGTMLPSCHKSIPVTKIVACDDKVISDWNGATTV